MIVLIGDARAQWAELDRRIAAFDAEFVRWTRENEDARRLATIPGIGATIASAMIAAVGRAETFEQGRDLPAWLGLVPRQFTTGGKTKFLGISKRGNKYLRKHGTTLRPDHSPVAPPCRYRTSCRGRIERASSLDLPKDAKAALP
jgi:transposase